MYDSYGDGWNGNYFNIGGQSFTASGYGSSSDVCLAEGCYDVTVDGGSWQGEVSWDFAGTSGGAPYSGEICIGGASSGSSETCYTLDMDDSYGDGWNGNYFNINGQSYTASGYGTDSTVCLASGCYDVSVDGGSWQGEVSWSINGYSGGAPYYGNLCF